MVSDDKPKPSVPAKREPLTPAKKKRLEKLFEHGSKQVSQDNGEYAAELFEQCVVGDPSNLIYIKAYVANLQKKYDNNRTGSKFAQFRERGPRSALKKALAAKQWDDAIQHGLKILVVNPWDKSALLGMAEAAENTGDIDPRMNYLKWAREAAPKDPDINKQCARAAEAIGKFDQAIAMWHRVELEKPDDQEAAREIARLAVAKTIAKDSTGEDGIVDKHAKPDEAVPEGEEDITAEERLRQKIALQPKKLVHYHELADLYISAENYKQAVEILAKTYEVSGEDPDIRERWDDVQMRYLRQQATAAKNRGDEDAKKKLLQQLVEKELAVYQGRCERYPNNLGFHYDLGLRYQLNKQYKEGIKEFQIAQNDPRRKGVCMLALGQCFQRIKQNRLAMTHYNTAIVEIPDRDAVNKKLALYLAGRMAMHLKDLDTAEKHLAQLAAMDFTYKDVSDLLDQIARLREGDEEGEGAEEDE